MNPSPNPEVHEAAIAVVGMACHVPGAPSVAAYWKLLNEGRSGVRELSEEELRQAGVEERWLSDPRYLRVGAPLQGMRDFDASFFGLSPKDAAIMDPQHRHFLECAWEALEHAGHDPSRFDGPVGVFGGCGMNAYYFQNLVRDPALFEEVGPFLLRHTGNDKDFLSTFVSYKLDLRGPSVGVQTACSTSLVAIHLAAQSLLAGECDLALAGGSTIELPHGQGYLYRENEILAKDGKCRPFDADASGTIFGSGAGIVVLRRLADAVRDGDTIHAVILGSAINNDGAGKAGWLAPSVQGQVDVASEALAVADVDPQSVHFLEAHGTGTAVGDPIEVEALSQAYGPRPDAQQACALGSVKANIGHLDTAAGVASFIKAVLALSNRQYPPNIHYTSPNPQIDFARTPFAVQAGAVPLPQPKPQQPVRAAVHSLGVGGTNAHVVLEAAAARVGATPTRKLQLLPLSARSDSALSQACLRLAEALEESAPSLEQLADAAFTLQEGRRAFACRTAIAAEDAEQAAKRLRERAAQLQQAAPHRATARDRSVAFLFPGGGAQYPGMAADLYAREPVFAQRLEQGLQLLKEKHDLDLGEIFASPPRDESHRARLAERLSRPSVQLPAIYLLEVALAELWRSWGVQPQALLGHSLGENAAACVAGVFQFEEGLDLVVLRGQLFEQLPPGGMLSIAASADAVESCLPSPLVVGARNAPEQTMVSGPREALGSFEQTLTEQGLEFQRVPIDCAAHSPALEPILDRFRTQLQSMQLSAPQVPILSNLTGTWLTDEQATDPEYWVSHLRQPVQFADGAGELLRDADRVLLEVGPGKILSSLARQHPLAGRERVVASSLRHPDQAADDQDFLLDALGTLWSAGVAIDWPELRGPQKRIRMPLPTYPFEKQEYWVEAKVQDPLAVDTVRAGFEQLQLDDWFSQTVWQRSPWQPPLESKIEGERWLVFLDRHGLAEALVDRLRAHGKDVICVREGDAFYRFDERAYALAPEGGRAGYEALMEDLAEQNALPDRIAHFWTVTDSCDPRPGSSLFHHHQERGFYSLFFLAQAFGALEHSGEVQLDVIGNGIHPIEGGQELEAEKATLLGPLAVIPREYEQLTTRSFDVLREDQSQAWVDEVLGRGENQHVGWRGSVRYLPMQIPLATDSSSPFQLDEEDVVLVTGGLGGLGMTTARHLAQRSGCRLVLLSRSGLPDREDWDSYLAAHTEDDPAAERMRAVIELESMASEVIVLAGDVANSADMRAARDVVDQHLGRLDVIVHAAGVLEDGVMQLRSPEAMERVFAPKVQGSQVLLQTFADLPLRSVVLFSSTSVLLGPAGQADYVGANAYLNALATSLRARCTHPDTQVLALNWGAWSDTGMAEVLAQRMRSRSRFDGERLKLDDPLFESWIRGKQQRAWSTRLSTDHWWLAEHRLQGGRAVLPGTALLELARRALQLHRADSAASIQLQDLSFLAACPVADGDARELRVVLRELDREQQQLEICSRDEAHQEAWTVHLRASFTQALANVAEIEAIASGKPCAFGGVQPRYLELGARWQSQVCLEQQGLTLQGELTLPEDLHGDLQLDRLHPGLVDTALGCALHVLPEVERAGFYVPLECSRISILGALPPRVTLRIRFAQSPAAHAEALSFDLQLFHEDGTLLLAMEQFQMRRLDGVQALCRHDRDPESMPQEFTPAELAFFSMLENGIQAEQGMEALDRLLGQTDAAVVAVSSIDLDDLRSSLDEATTAGRQAQALRFERPQLDSTFAAPTSALEKKLVSWWEELLGIDEIGIHDDFFALGGHSLIAVRLFARVRSEFGVEHPLSVLFEAPTIARYASVLEQEIGPVTEQAGTTEQSAQARRRFRYLVPMNEVRESSEAPFFLVAGMFGNVLNLRHLAMQLGSDRAVYAVQAKGLREEEAPHRRFEDMARDALAEIQQVQPHGPYLLGGFSGGGITAFEMAQQLREKGEDTAALVLLDTPIPAQPRADWRDRIAIYRQRLRENGPGYAMRWLKQRLAWEWSRLRGKKEVVSPGTPAEFRSELVKEAFLEALEYYELRPYPGLITLFRPQLQNRFALRNGRFANEYREIQDPCNHWLPFAEGGLDTFEVDGDHDSMVLEPHVRVLGEEMRLSLVEAMEQWRQKQV